MAGGVLNAGGAWKPTGTGAAVGAVAGGGGVYTIFTVAHLDQIFARGASFITMLDALGIFSALSLFAVFVYAWSTPAAPVPDTTGKSRTPVIQLIPVVILSFVLVATIVVLAVRAFMAPDQPPPPTPSENVKLKTTFANFGEFHDFAFPSGSVLDPPQTHLQPQINDGSPHDFDANGTLQLDISSTRNEITVDVEKLDQLKIAYKTAADGYRFLLQKQNLLQKSCDPGLNAGRMSQTCVDLLRMTSQPQPASQPLSPSDTP